MIDLSKSQEFFQCDKQPIHIIGIGAIGSTIAELLTRLGADKLHLYDFDKVAPENVANQMYKFTQIGATKIEAMTETLKEINPEIEIIAHTDGWTEGTPLRGYVFLAVDSIKVRQDIIKENLYNSNIKAIFDFRMRLTDAQHYAADWSDLEQKEILQRSMNFTEEEAKEATPVSACGTTLSVAPTIRTIVSLGITNWMNFVKENKIKTLILVDTFKYLLDAF